MKVGEEHELDFLKISRKGEGIGYKGPFAVHAFGVFPEERARVRITRRKKRICQAEVLEVIKPRAERISPLEDHYLSCSPFQAVEYEYEQQLKRTMLSDLYDDLSDGPRISDFYFPQMVYGYRSKLEFSFTTDSHGQLQLSFYKRGDFSTKLPLPAGCKLGSPAMNQAALAIIKRLRAHKVSADALKNLMIRESKSSGDIIATLFWQDRSAAQELSTPDLPKVSGTTHVYSRSESPAATYDEILYSTGSAELKERINGLDIAYPADGFFQNHLEGFEEVLKHIKTYVGSVDKLVELYSGVGTIGLYVADQTKQTHGLESVPSAVEYAQQNAQHNRINNYSATLGLAEKMDYTYLKDVDVLVLDPPRAGMHPKVIKRIRHALPERIIYLSCNPLTQAHDYTHLREYYRWVDLRGFDFYPRTPHMESLLFLERK